MKAEPQQAAGCRLHLEDREQVGDGLVQRLTLRLRLTFTQQRAQRHRQPGDEPGAGEQRQQGVVGREFTTNRRCAHIADHLGRKHDLAAGLSGELFESLCGSTGRQIERPLGFGRDRGEHEQWHPKENTELSMQAVR